MEKFNLKQKYFFSISDGKYYKLLIIDNIDFTLPYIDVYGGTRVSLSENKKHYSDFNNANNFKPSFNLCIETILDLERRWNNLCLR